MVKTLTYSDSAKGWTSFYSYDPEWIANLNDEYFTFKNGQIYVHHKNDNSRNTFYGQSYNSKIEFVYNEGPSEVKMFRALKTEGNSGNWDVTVQSELDKGHIGKASFLKKEDMYYAYVRNDNDEVDTKKLTFQGLGLCTAVSQNDLYVSNLSDSTISVGDVVYKATVTDDQIGEMTEIGVVETINDEYIVLESLQSLVSANDFLMLSKNQTAESEGVRGYYAKISMTNDSTTPIELYAVNAEVTKSNL